MIMNALVRFLAAFGVKRERIAEIGGVAITETTYRLAQVPLSTQRAITLKHQPVMLPSDTVDNYITIDEAATRFGISKETLRRLCKDGIIDAQKADRRWLLSEKSLEEWISNQEKIDEYPLVCLLPNNRALG